jgi:hypothetical protein
MRTIFFLILLNSGAQFLDQWLQLMKERNQMGREEGTGEKRQKEEFVVHVN